MHHIGFWAQNHAAQQVFTFQLSVQLSLVSMILRFVRATGLIMLIAGSRKAMVVCALGGGPQLNVHILSHYYVTSILIQSHYFVIYIPI